MNLVEYKKTIKHPVRVCTETFLLKGEDVCLGLKKRGFGKGNYLGIGGKVEEDKDRKEISEDNLAVAKNAACREIQEEIDVIVYPKDLLFMGIFKFYFPHITDESWNQQVYVFTANKWQGEPVARADEAGQIEIEPEWVNKINIPFDKMWDDAHYWLLEVLDGKKLDGEFVFGERLKVMDYFICCR